MGKLTIALSLAAVALGSHVIAAVADDVPTFDVRVTCRAESQGDPGAGIAAACLADEQRARNTLVAQWAQFAPASKATCMQTENGIPGIRSYVELLTCLQLARDAKSLPNE
jgi:hypothetical protein